MKQVWEIVKWIFDNSIYILAGIGLASVIVKGLDAAVERMIVRHPSSKFWITLDYSLDTTDTVLGKIVDGLRSVALNKVKDKDTIR
jgi:hypothetical protein